jgi:hypothetical protein
LKDRRSVETGSTERMIRAAARDWRWGINGPHLTAGKLDQPP